MIPMRAAALFASVIIAPALGLAQSNAAQGNAVQSNAKSATASPARPLQAVRAIISQSEDGIPLPGGNEFQPGDVIFFSFQVENYRISPTGKVDLVGHMQAFDAKGAPVAPADEQMIGTSVNAEDKDWKPKLRLQLQLPSIAQPGAWKIRYDVTDRQTRQSVRIGADIRRRWQGRGTGH